MRACVDVCVCAFLDCVVFVNLLRSVAQVITALASCYGGPRIIFLASYAGYSDEESSSFIPRPLQCWEGIFEIHNPHFSAVLLHINWHL